MAISNQKNRPGRKWPRNTVTLQLSGSLEEFVQRYTLCQLHYRYWILCNSAVRVRYRNRLIYTTPLDGTFYYVLRHEEDQVTFVIDARQGWLVGFITARGIFQMRVEDLVDLYMDSSNCKPLHFFGNHSMISPHGTGETRLNLYFLRKCVSILCAYSGPTQHSDPPGFRTAIGLKVILLLEAKFREIYERNREKLGQPFEDILGNDWVTLLITNWSSISQQNMLFLSTDDYIPHNCGIEELKTIDDLLDAAFYLHIDAYDAGIFAHTPLDPAPRRLIWAPVDPGLGDGDIPKHLEPECPGVILCRKRVLSDAPRRDVDGKRRKGLVGGGLGGTPSAPECFIQWTQKDNAEQCDIIVTHLCKDLGLEVKNATRDPVTEPEYLLPKQGKGGITEVQNIGPDEEADNVLSGGPLASDLNCLREPGFLSCELISFILNSLASSMNTDQVLLIGPAVSTLLYSEAHLDTVAVKVELLDINAKSMVLFPVNNNENPSNADGGTHWSLLVLDQRAPGIRRFTHLDSAGGVNYSSAQRLIERLTSLSDSEVIMIEDQGPQQDNDYDCGLFLIANAKVICQWWMSRSEEDWEAAVAHQVNSASVAALRVDLLHRLERYMRKKA